MCYDNPVGVIDRIISVVLAATLFAIAAMPARADSGVHIVVISGIDDGSWLIREYIDNALIPMEGEVIEGSDDRILTAGIHPDPGSADSLAILSARSEPLVIFEAQNIVPLEERIAESGRGFREAEFQKSLENQVINGLFQVPIWLWLAASEVPVRRIDIARLLRLPDWREEVFNPSTFAAVGEFSGWEAGGTVADGVIAHQTDIPGEGAGIVVEYLYSGILEGLTLSFGNHDGISAVYLDSGLTLRADGFSTVLWNPGELLASYNEGTQIDAEKLNWSYNRISDADGVLVRNLLVPPVTSDSLNLTLETVTEPVIEHSDALLPDIPASVMIVLLWLIYGLLVVTGNLIFRFSGLKPLDLLARSVAIYPVYLLVSLLVSGLWGLGFIPATVLVARVISGEGKRLTAFGVVLSINFMILIASLTIVR